VAAPCSQWIACSPRRNYHRGGPLNRIVSRHEMSAKVICPKCKWVFPPLSVWAYIQTTQRERKHCPRCWTDGPFSDATDRQIVDHEAHLSEGSKIWIALEIGLFVVLMAAVAWTK